MAIRRITASDIAPGQPLPWDVYSTPGAGRPFLRKGDSITAGQLDGWLAAGLYADAGAPTSVLLHLNDINRRLERLLGDLRAHGSANVELRTLAGELAGAVAYAPDVALAAIFLNQIGGTYAVRHCTETAIVATLVSQQSGKPDEEVLIVAAAAMTMNVGMVREAELFQDRQHALSVEERSLILRHPSDSADMLRWAGVDDEEWLDLVLLHHENDDGSGYPHGRLADQISQNARLIGLADRYCAFVSARNYRKSLLPPEALARLSALPVDPAMLAQFARLLGPYPPGTLVRLQDGAVGVVAARDKVHVLRDAAGVQTRVCDTSAPGCAIAEALDEASAGTRFPMKQVWGELAGL